MSVDDLICVKYLEQYLAPVVRPILDKLLLLLHYCNMIIIIVNTTYKDYVNITIKK